ncbi:hypothetical protein [Pelagicoccus sp. SDUM812003]|uniref:hypothetical protein n=1 Tax=Pelagicoccus sp. SDUM812003 TaxID=3041267 RepID=UPI00280C597A|nr:hypothetical protein [Pelagicoccus sp. SDUM812003]MDQ8205496.1 hypothetical protein [Pelagicoccus sp. SDUM812003]
MKNVFKSIGFARGLPSKLVELSQQASRYSDQLYQFGQVTDKEFVILAESVSSIQTCIQNTIGQTQKLGESLDGCSEENAFRSAFEIGKRAIELVHSSSGVEFALSNQFELIDSLVSECETIKSEFDHNQVIFRSLATGFAIESARCDEEAQAVFRTVVSDFHRIDESIAKTLDSGFSELQAVLKEMDDIRRAWDAEFNGSENTVERQLESIREEIHRIETILTPCVADCSDIKNTLEEIELAISPIIICLQNQDIVRQKLEHIANALNEIERIASPACKGKPRKQRLSELFAHSSVQGRQLDYAVDLLAETGEQAFSSIADAQAKSDAVAQRLGALQDTLFHQFGTSSIAFAFGQQIEELSRITEFSGRVHQQLAQIDQRIVKVVQVYNREISSRQQDIRLIALNAQVAASRLEEGGALERLAQETSVVSEANQRTSKKLSSALENALEQLRSTRESSVAHVEVLNKDRQELFESSQDIDARLQHHISGTISETRALLDASNRNASTIQDLPQRLSFPQRLQTEFTPIRETLREINAISLKLVGKRELPQEVQASLNEHRERYTMQTERALHDQTFAQISNASGFTSFN